MTPTRLVLVTLLATLAGAARLPAAPPNVLIVIADDQGYGDLGCHGNPLIRTPRLDAFAGESVRLKNFRVCPVCSPTRSSLMTGFYNYRTGVVDTYIGRSMMRPGIKTLAEYLAAAGYRTGLFGKWHLGDNYPLRPEDRGFRQTLWLQGGGLAQPADHPDLDPKTAYFDPILTRNGKEVKAKGYCTDVFTDGAIEFLKADPAKPFFAYVAYNAPHAPYQVPDELVTPYRKLDLTPAGFPKVGQPWATPKLNTGEIARAYAMIENIDTNFGRMMKTLEDAKLAENTVVIFLTDNGPGGVRFNAGLRNRKGTVYDGGLRVPCYVRWPAKLEAGRVVEQAAAHIDLTPTVLEACGVKPDARFDGRSLLPLLTGEKAGLPGRTLYFQWHRGDEPEKFRAFAAVGPKYKLVQAAGVQEKAKWQPKYELFDVAADPFEQHDLAAKLPDEVAKLKAEYAAWFADVGKNGYDPPRIVIGSDKQPLVRLTKQDWRVTKGDGWGTDGYWLVNAAREGEYKVAVRSREAFTVMEFLSTTGSVAVAVERGTDETKAAGTTIRLPKGEQKVTASVETGGKKRAADYVEIEWAGK